MTKTLTIGDVTWKLLADFEEVPVRGNAQASGDDEDDQRYEDEILRRLDDGDVWAWAMVTVTGEYMGLTASAYLGCCSYSDANDFKRPGGYYDDLRHEVLADLQSQLEEITSKNSK